MSKTDKELTVELVNNYINAWNNASVKTDPLKAKDLIDLIGKVHTAVQNLPMDKQ